MTFENKDFMVLMSDKERGQPFNEMILNMLTQDQRDEISHMFVAKVTEAVMAPTRKQLIMFIYDHHTKRELAEEVYKKLSEEALKDLKQGYEGLYGEDEGPTPWDNAED